MHESAPMRRPSLAARVATWNATAAAAVVATAATVVHEVLYHIGGGTDYPFVIELAGTRALIVSHGGLDMIAVGQAIVGTLMLIEAAKRRRRCQ